MPPTHYIKHHIKDVGHWERCQGQRYWVGNCTCGSGREGYEVYDDNGIYFGISCTSCNREPAPGPYDEEIDSEPYYGSEDEPW